MDFDELLVYKTDLRRAPEVVALSSRVASTSDMDHEFAQSEWMRRVRYQKTSLDICYNRLVDDTLRYTAGRWLYEPDHLLRITPY